MTFDLKLGANILAAGGIDDPLREARILARKATTETEYLSFLERRAKHEPTAYIFERKEFWSLEFEVNPAVLIPRPDSETLVETALKLLKDNPPQRILDLGTGSGCLLIALLSEWPGAKGIAVDISSSALAVAKRNSNRLGVADRMTLVHQDFGAPIEGRFDLVISNPPYIADHVVDSLDKDVRDYEPHLALKGGKGGLTAIESIARRIPALLVPGAPAVVEIGFDQANAAAQILQNQGLRVINIVKDLAGCDRVIVSMMPQ